MPYNDESITLVVAPSRQRPWRAQPLWLLIGLLAGVVCGAVAGALLGAPPVLAGDETLLSIFSFAIMGGLVGGPAGLVVGFVMTFLGGSHLRGTQARAQAFGVTLISTGFVFVGLFGPVFFYDLPAAVLAILLPLAGASISSWLAPKVAV